LVHALDLLGTFAFALSGALLATRKRMDIFGVVVLAIAAGLGGGIVRDAAAELATAIRLALLRYRWSAPRPRL
jgi:uncharacterized membrane protein YeiH